MERGPAVCGCGRPGYDVDQVSVHLRAGEQTGELRAGVSGVYRCGSPWLCPVCAVGKARDRAERVRTVAGATYDRGGQVALIVLTVSHAGKTPLADVKQTVQTASRKARQGVTWARLAERHGILGVVVGQEVTLSRANGWHYHQHLSVPVDGPTDDEIREVFGEAAPLPDRRRIGPWRREEQQARQDIVALARMPALERIGPPSGAEVLAELVHARAQAAGEAVAERYKAAIRGAGGRVSNEHGTYVRVADDEADAADYTAKGSMAWEVAGGPTKDRTKAAESLTPWDVAELAYAGDGWARHRWAEYVEVMPGTRSCVVSAALAARLGVSTSDDREEGEQVLHEADEIVGRVEAQTWRRWLRHGLGSTFLARVERGGEVGFAEAVTRTDEQAASIEARYDAQRATRQADREAQQARRDRDEALAEAVARVYASPGAGTRTRARHVLAAMSAERPDRPPPDEATVVTALAAVPAERAAFAQAVADQIGGVVVGVGLAA